MLAPGPPSAENGRGCYGTYSALLKNITPLTGTASKKQKHSHRASLSDIPKLSKKMKGLYETGQLEMLTAIIVMKKDKSTETPLACELACLRKAQDQSAKGAPRLEWNWMRHTCLADGEFGCTNTPCLQITLAMERRQNLDKAMSQFQITIDSEIYSTEKVRPSMRLRFDHPVPPGYQTIDVRPQKHPLASPFRGNFTRTAKAYAELAWNPPAQLWQVEGIAGRHNVKMDPNASYSGHSFKTQMAWLRQRALTTSLCVVVIQLTEEPSEADTILNLIKLPSTPREGLPSYLWEENMPKPDEPKSSTPAAGSQAGSSSGHRASGAAEEGEILKGFSAPVAGGSKRKQPLPYSSAFRQPVQTSGKGSGRGTGSRFSGLTTQDGAEPQRKVRPQEESEAAGDTLPVAATGAAATGAMPLHGAAPPPPPPGAEPPIAGMPPPPPPSGMPPATGAGGEQPPNDATGAPAPPLPPNGTPLPALPPQPPLPPPTMQPPQATPPQPTTTEGDPTPRRWQPAGSADDLVAASNCQLPVATSDEDAEMLDVHGAQEYSAADAEEALSAFEDPNANRSQGDALGNAPPPSQMVPSGGGAGDGTQLTPTPGQPPAAPTSGPPPAAPKPAEKPPPRTKRTTSRQT